LWSQFVVDGVLLEVPQTATWLLALHQKAAPARLKRQQIGKPRLPLCLDGVAKHTRPFENFYNFFLQSVFAQNYTTPAHTTPTEDTMPDTDHPKPLLTRPTAITIGFSAYPRHAEILERLQEYYGIQNKSRVLQYLLEQAATKLPKEKTSA
jgi:hypothetical protein